MATQGGFPSGGFVRFDKREIEQSIPQRFAQQVRQCSDKIAVKARDQSLTYGELDRLSNQIARLILQKLGEGNEPVALFFGQSALLVAAILGTLKAGKLYLPLDPVLSVSQNREGLADSGARLLLTEPRLRQRTDGFAPPSMPTIDLVDAVSTDLSAEDPGLALSPNALAYLFYTSGSTGRAKGIADTHRNVLHNVMRYTNNLHIGVNDRLTLIQTAGFSGAVSSLYCALLNGATSYPFSLKEEGPARLCDWAAGEKLTMFHAVPSIFRLLARGGHGYPDLRIIRLEGDRATPSDIALFKERFSENCTLVNGLGATECGIVRQFFVTKYTPVPESVVPIGHAIEDMDVLLLDEGGAPVPPARPGKSPFAAAIWRQNTGSGPI